jgi:hypothetical protein
MTHTADNLIRLTAHPTDPAVLLLHTPPAIRDRLGRFAPARWSPAFTAYLVPAGMQPQLVTWAKHERVHLVDERLADDAPPPAAPRVTRNYAAGPECGFCGQPGSSTYPPKRCPGCGELWRPIVYTDVVDAESLTTCRSCEAKVPGRFPYCSHCGELMSYDQDAAPVAPAGLADTPATLGDVMREMQSAGELPAPAAGQEDMTP